MLRRPLTWPLLRISLALAPITGLSLATPPSTVVTTVPVLEDLAAAVSCGGDSLSIASVVPRGVDPHTFHLTFSSRKTISESKWLLSVGRGYESWLSPGNLTKGSVNFVLGDKLRLERIGSQTAHGGVNSQASNADLDPHFWQSPRLVSEAAQLISGFLVDQKILPREKAQSCTSAFQSALATTRNDLASMIAAVPPERRIIALNHDAMGYFAREFGLKTLPVLGTSTESQPTPASLKRLIEDLKRDKVRAIFLETGAPPKLIESLSRETGIRIGGELVVDTLGAKKTPEGTILGMWRRNMTTIVEALK